jgi:prophage DNA circulation protein
MTPAELTESTLVLQTMMSALSATLLSASGIPGASLRYGINDLLSNAEYLIRTATIGTALAALFDLAYQAGATITTIDSVRVALVNLEPVTDFATCIANIGVQMVMAVEVQIYSATVWTSRQDVDSALVQIRMAFASAIEFAADNYDPTSFQALIAAQGAIVNHLNTTARPLPNMITYNVGRVMTSHALAQRLYGDPSRADELMLENKVSHPSFMPAIGNALST